jgi:G3E family GTPase
MVEFIFTAGALGSGKTTFINVIAPGLERKGRVGAAISDLGTINDDVRRVRISKDNITGFKAGCVCCERKQDLEELVSRIDPRLDYFIVEPSGASNIYDMIQVVQEAKNSKRPDFEIGHVFTTVPVSNWEQVKALRAVKAGIQAASSIVLTKTHSGNIRVVNQYLDDMGATQSRIQYNGEQADLSYLLSGLPKWRDPIVPIVKGHEHFNKISFSIPPNATKEDIISKLEQLSALGVPRVKGIVPERGFEFDLSYGAISASDYSGNQIAARGTAIFEGDGKRIIEVVNSFDVGGASDIGHSVSVATINEMLQAFHYHYRFAERTSPMIEGRVRANFEGTDNAYTLGKEIYLRTNREESAPLEMALVPYLDVRWMGLQALQSSDQEDKSYIGVMLGSYMIQMLGEKDGVPFNRLTESRWIQRIKEEVSPLYFEHLRGFRETDLRYFVPDDKHFPFFVWMAEQSAPYVNNSLVNSASDNMVKVHDKTEIASRWRKLQNG